MNYGRGPGDLFIILGFLAMIFFVVAMNSLTALEQESYNAENRRESVYSLLVGIAGFLFFVWLSYQLYNFFHHG